MPNNQTLSATLSERVRRLSDETLVVALEAYREGRHAGAARLGDELTAYLNELFAELEASYDDVDPERVEASYAGAQPSPTVAAHFGGAGDVLERIRSRVRALAKKGRG